MLLIIDRHEAIVEERRIAVTLVFSFQAPGVERAKFDAVVEKMADDALASGSPQNNPRVPTAGEIVALYHAAW